MKTRVRAAPSPEPVPKLVEVPPLKASKGKKLKKLKEPKAKTGARPGRPKAEAGNKKGVQVFVSLTDAEKVVMQEAADAKGLTVSYYIRFRLGLSIDSK